MKNMYYLFDKVVKMIYKQMTTRLAMFVNMLPQYVNTSINDNEGK